MDKEQARRQWNSAAPGWARLEPVIGSWLKQSTQAMLDTSRVRPGSRVVDIACGAGDQPLAAARRVGSTGHVLATDISEEMITFVGAQAEASNIDHLTARCCAAEELESGGTPFDAAICRLGLMLIPDRAGVVRAIRDASTWRASRRGRHWAARGQSLPRRAAADPPWPRGQAAASTRGTGYLRTRGHVRPA